MRASGALLNHFVYTFEVETFLGPGVCIFFSLGRKPASPNNPVSALFRDGETDRHETGLVNKLWGQNSSLHDWAARALNQ